MAENQRPLHLPDFKKPPLHEVVVGVQFAVPQTYNSIQTNEVWELYKESFPHFQAQFPLPPVFETFGALHAPVSFSLMQPGNDFRYWFISQTNDELIQFQSDRLLHNWRRVVNSGNDYPHFEAVIDKFETEIRKLENYFKASGHHQLAINQCEVSYINHLMSPDQSQPNAVLKWLKFLNFNETPDDVGAVFRRVLTNIDGQPFARLTVEVNNLIDADGRKGVAFNLTVRGAPQGTGIADALRFLYHGREIIVSSFKDFTTSDAHSYWEIIP